MTARRQDSALSGVLSVLMWAVLLVVVAAVAVLVVVPKALGGTTLTVLTGSMEPTLAPGDVVAVRTVTDAATEVQVGDVVTFQPVSGDPTLVTHRVVAINQPNVPDGEATFITKGDANDVADENPVQYVQIRGAVWYSVPYIGWINNVVNGDMRSVAIPIIAGLLFIYAGYQFVSGRIERSRERKAAKATDTAD